MPNLFVGYDDHVKFAARAALTFISIAAVAFATIDPHSEAAPKEHPDSIEQPPKDGCERNPGGLIAGTSPQWAYVFGKREPVYIKGVARNARPTYTDLFRAHDSYDMNIFFDPDPAYENYLATANISDEATQDKDEIDTMEAEWEQRAYPLWAWPTAGDKVEVLGSWIWDCGHWGPQDFTDPRYFAPGTQEGEVVTGERTEIHPPRMVVVHRDVPSISKRGEEVTDVIISSVGTFARAIENRAAGYCDQPADLCKRRTKVQDRNYSFNASAGPKPNGASRVVYRVVDRGSRNAPKPVIKRTATGIHVDVPFKGYGNKNKRSVFAKTFFVGWNVARPVHHYHVSLKQLMWESELDGTQTGQCAPNEPCTGNPQQSQPPDEVNVYVEVAGQWMMLDIPELIGVAPGDKFDLSQTFDVYVAEGSVWRVLGRGRECDQPNMKECSVQQEEGLNDDGGVFADEYGPGFMDPTGEHVGVGGSPACDMSTQTPCFELIYEIEDLGSG